MFFWKLEKSIITVRSAICFIKHMNNHDKQAYTSHLFFIVFTIFICQVVCCRQTVVWLSNLIWHNASPQMNGVEVKWSGSAFSQFPIEGFKVKINQTKIFGFYFYIVTSIIKNTWDVLLWPFIIHSDSQVKSYQCRKINFLQFLFHFIS